MSGRVERLIVFSSTTNTHTHISLLCVGVLVINLTGGFDENETRSDNVTVVYYRMRGTGMAVVVRFQKRSDETRRHCSGARVLQALRLF